MIGHDGYLKLINFGSAKELSRDEPRTSSFVGTPDYMAPEIILEQEYDFSVDWWALGILAYEMITGFPPFYTGDKKTEERVLDEV